ncbi:MAG: glycosyltransferase family 2 protein [Bacteriovorax sp.]|jgi:glycosyltransferase involved in cell wall biosynthesis
MSTIKLSVVIITLNEEKNIGRCLDSVKDIADEILVVDSLSTDKTRLICQGYSVRFVEQKFLGYVEQKNFALNLATHDYVLSLDADEALTPELIAEVKKIKEKFVGGGYAFNRITRYNGHWVRHCGWYPDIKLRMVEKKNAFWVGNNPHDALEVKGAVTHVPADILHYSYDSISSHVMQTNKFSTIEAASLYQRGKRATLMKLATRPAYQFFKDYILRLGILDGRYGFVICFINSIYVLLKYAKMIELDRSKSL